MQFAVSEACGNVMLKSHQYGRQTMAVTEFQNGVEDQIIWQLQQEQFNENIQKFQKNQLTPACSVLSTAELTGSSYQERDYNNDKKKNEIISVLDSFL